MKIIIAGGGKIGSTLTKDLSAEGHEVTIIDKGSEILEHTMQNYDVMGLQGNAASAQTLLAASVEDADLLIAATDKDEVNLLACMTAHGLNSKLHTIARIRNPEYLYQAYQMRNYFALNLTINPEFQAAEEISNLIKFPGFLKVETFAKGRIRLVELKVKEKSLLNGVKLAHINRLVKLQFLVCAVLRDGKCIMPDGNFTLKENDKIYITASKGNLSLLLNEIGVITKPIKNVMITGGGKITYYLTKDLQKSKIKCTIVEIDEHKCSDLADNLPGARILCGDASNQEFMEGERVNQYDAMVNLTGIDELNIVMSLYGESQEVGQVITKLSHTENTRLLDALQIGSIVSPKESASNIIVQYVRAMENQVGAAVSVHSIANGQAEAIEFVVTKDCKHVGEYLKDISIKKNILLAAISKGYKSEVPSGNSKFEIGDVVIVVTNKDNPILSFNDIFEEGL